MSSDNYFLLRRHNGGFVVTMEFASDDEPRPIRQRPDGTYEGGMTRWFSDYSQASNYAHSEYAEYGVEDWTATDVVENERQRILAALNGDEFWETATAIRDIWGPKFAALVRGEC